MKVIEPPQEVVLKDGRVEILIERAERLCGEADAESAAQELARTEGHEDKEVERAFSNAVSEHETARG